MNDVKLYGTITDDPDIRQTEGQNGYKMARFTLKVEQSMRDDGKSYSDDVALVAFRKNADIVEKYLKKDMSVLVCAHIHAGSYTTKFGDMVPTQSIVVDKVEIVKANGLEEPEAFQAMPETVAGLFAAENEY